MLNNNQYDYYLNSLEVLQLHFLPKNLSCQKISDQVRRYGNIQVLNTSRLLQKVKKRIYTTEIRVDHQMNFYISI